MAPNRTTLSILSRSVCDVRRISLKRAASSRHLNSESTKISNSEHTTPATLTTFLRHSTTRYRFSQTAVKLPTQYMHTMTTVMFLKEPETRESVLERLDANPWVALTKLNNSAQVFSRGRDDGFDGRIFNQVVVYADSLFVSKDGMKVLVQSSTPQDGNSLMSTASLVARKIKPEGWREAIKESPLNKKIFDRI